MSSAIPPLVCDSPPPIDDLENDDGSNDINFDHSDDGKQILFFLINGFHQCLSLVTFFLCLTPYYRSLNAVYTQIQAG